MKIRKARSGDLAEILRLNFKLFEFERQFGDTYNLEWTYSEKGRKYFEDRLKQKDAVCLVAEEDGQVIGYLVAFTDTFSFRSRNPICEIENMFIEESYRNKGMGRALVTELKQILKKRGVKRIRVESGSDNEGAIAFYKAMGLKDFNIIEKISSAPPCAGYKYNRECGQSVKIDL